MSNEEYAIERLIGYVRDSGETAPLKVFTNSYVSVIYSKLTRAAWCGGTTYFAGWLWSCGEYLSIYHTESILCERHQCVDNKAYIAIDKLNARILCHCHVPYDNVIYLDNQRSEIYF